ncbi:methyl-accepting chemotaxis protein [Pseudomonas sp. AA-38]|uniref:methyl-accepting chemotaxis protein n=1 Tax=Pseudomonas sp. AA-38 TaxID=3028807 RepID=UPI0023F8B2B4|nr:methyl-accepting chemotaxis protein [Pseudomonas sp. AA-38]
MLLRKLRIGTRAAAGFALLALLVLLLGTITLAQMKRMDEASDAIERKWLPAVLALEDISMNMSRVRALTLRAHIIRDAQQRAADQAKIEQCKHLLEQAEQAYVALINSDEEQHVYERFRDERERYMNTQAQVMNAMSAGDEAQVQQLVAGDLSAHANAVVVALQALVRQNEKGAKLASSESKSAYSNAIEVVLIALVAAIASTIVLALLLTRSITQPLAQAVSIAQDIAAGDLNHDISDAGTDEPAQLLQALDAMRHNLRDTLQQVADSSSLLASSSEELHAVTEDGRRGLYQQNAEIEQAVTAVTEMTAAVEEVARNAVSTSQATRDTDQSARHGHAQVGRTIDSIRLLTADIGSAGEEVSLLAGNVRNIGQVVNVIRAIADQTNLLALNAAIEAARAGDQGRGFAVVADEVRALAQRTQQSTGEIEQMIGAIQKETEQAVATMNASMERADSTLELAQSAGAALDTITEAIGTINERNLVIASASEQQAQVAREVDRNLVNIRDLSLQSSAGADQTTAASQELSRLAVALNTLLTRFRL